MRRLDRLTQDETRMTEVHILEVVHGLMNNMKVVMEGESSTSVQVRASDQTVMSVGGEASTSAIRKTLGMVNFCGLNRIPRSLAEC